MFQRKIPRLNPEVYRLSSHPTSAQLPLLDFPPLLSLKPLPTSRVTQRRSSRGFVPTPNPSLAQEPLNLQRILSETHSFPNICGPKTQRFRVLSRNARFSVKRSVLAQDASFEPRPFSQRNLPPNVDNKLSQKPTPSQTYVALKRSVLGRFPGRERAFRGKTQRFSSRRLV